MNGGSPRTGGPPTSTLQDPGPGPGQSRSGAAVLRKDGKIYVTDWAQYDGHAVSAVVQLRVRDLRGERLYPGRSITWSVRVVEIEWLVAR